MYIYMYIYIYINIDMYSIYIYILPHISRSKDNQTMKLGKLIKYNKRNIFLQKLCRK